MVVGLIVVLVGLVAWGVEEGYGSASTSSAMERAGLHDMSDGKS